MAVDLEESLLAHDTTIAREDPETNHQQQLQLQQQQQQQEEEEGELVCSCERRGEGTSIAHGSAHLILTSVGAGLLSLPRACATVGVFLGVFIFVFVGWCTYVCCDAIVVGSARHRESYSYGSLVHGLFGRAGYLALQWSIIVHVYGVMIVYIVIIGDVLLGDGHDGIIPYVLGRHGYLDAHVTVAVVVFVSVTPLLIPRTLDRIGSYSKISVYFILYLAGTVSILCVIAIVQGASGLDTVRVWPQTSSWFELVQAVFTSFAVTALAFTCHFNLIAVHSSLSDGRVSAMQRAMKGSSLFVTTLYTLVGLSGYILFGSSVNGDVLRDLTIEFTASLVGSNALAGVAIGLSMLAYCGALLVNYVLKVWAVRNALVEVFLQKSEHDLPAIGYYSLTALLVISSYGISITVPSVWFLAALIGSTACAVFSYLFPGLLLVRRGSFVVGYFMITLSILLAISGTIHTILQRHDDTLQSFSFNL